MSNHLPDDEFFEALVGETEFRAPERLKDQIFSALTSGLVEQEEFFETLASAKAPDAVAPSRLKSQIYSTLVLAQAEAGPLLSLAECKGGGRGLCVFEELVRITAVGPKMQALNYCRVCHARVLGERVEQAAIYWPGCPYVSFQNR